MIKLFQWPICWSFFTLCCLFACNQNDSFDEYATYVSQEDSGLSIQQIHEEFVFTARYVPIEYQAIKDESPSLDNYLGHMYLQLHIQSTGSNTNLKDWLLERYPDDHEAKWQEFLLQIQQSFSLHYGAAEYPCVLYHVVPPAIKGYGASILLVFKDEVEHRQNDFNEPLELRYNDAIWTSKELQFSFRPENLNAISLPTFNQ